MIDLIENVQQTAFLMAFGSYLVICAYEFEDIPYVVAATTVVSLIASSLVFVAMTLIRIWT